MCRLRIGMVAAFLILLVSGVAVSSTQQICVRNTTPSSQEGLVPPISATFTVFNPIGVAKTYRKEVGLNNDIQCVSFVPGPDRQMFPVPPSFAHVTLWLPTKEFKSFPKTRRSITYSYECCKKKWYNPYNKTLYCYPSGQYPLPAPYNKPCVRPQ